jgi:hypothetical protein
MDRDRVTVQKAALRLGVKDDAIRKRIQRGTLEHEKGPDGRVYVYLDATEDAAYVGHHNGTASDTAKDASQNTTQDALLENLRDQVEYLRSMLQEERDARRRADMIIAQLSQANASLAKRVPELEAPQSHEEAAEGSEPRSNGGASQAATEEPRRRSWWREFFGIRE